MKTGTLYIADIDTVENEGFNINNPVGLKGLPHILEQGGSVSTFFGRGPTWEAAQNSAIAAAFADGWSAQDTISVFVADTGA